MLGSKKAVALVFPSGALAQMTAVHVVLLQLVRTRAAGFSAYDFRLPTRVSGGDQ